MIKVDYEMEAICKIYGYMDEGDKNAWSLKNAEDVVSDEIKICGMNNKECFLKNPTVVYEVIREFIEQDKKDGAFYD